MEKKTVVASSLAAFGAVSAFVLKDKDKREQLESKWNTLVNKFKNGKDEGSLPVQKAGLSHPKEIENNKMVSEGSTYGVHYYNKEKQA